MITCTMEDHCQNFFTSKDKHNGIIAAAAHQLNSQTMPLQMLQKRSTLSK